MSYKNFKIKIKKQPQCTKEKSKITQLNKYITISVLLDFSEGGKRTLVFYAY